MKGSGLSDSFPREGEKSLFPPYVQSGSDGMPKPYNFFGYSSQQIERAIKTNRPDMVREAFERGWFDNDTRTLDGMGMVKMARKFGSEDAALALIALGFDDEPWAHPPVSL